MVVDGSLAGMVASNLRIDTGADRTVVRQDYSRKSLIQTSVIRTHRSTERYAKPHPPQLLIKKKIFFFFLLSS